MRLINAAAFALVMAAVANGQTISPKAQTKPTLSAPPGLQPNQWVQITSGTADIISDLSFANPQVGFAVAGIGDADFGYRGQVWKTVDGGYQWAEIVNSDLSYSWNGVQALTPEIVVISGAKNLDSGQSGVLRYSTNGGASWSDDIVLSKEVGLGRIRIPSLPYALALGVSNGVPPGGIFYSYADGTSAQGWSEVSPTNNWFGIEFSVLPDGHAAVTGTDYCSSTNWSQWSCRPPIDEIADYGVFFTDDYNGWTGTNINGPTIQGAVHRTTDGGKTWSDRTLNTTLIPINEVLFITPAVGWATGGYGNGDTSTGIIFGSSDGGQTWTQTLNVGYQFYACDSKPVTGGYQAWCAGTNPYQHQAALYTIYVPLSSTSTAVTYSPNPAIQAAPVTLTATVSSSGAAPTGAVHFYYGMTELGSAAVNSSGQATISVSGQVPPGNYTVAARYSGDASTGPSNSTANVMLEAGSF